MTKVALVMTVKNEERLLSHNLTYHFKLGVSKAYIYFDNTTDNGKNSIEHLENVVIQDSVSPSLYAHQKLLEKFTVNAKEHHTARQCLNTYDALEKCRKDNIDWLISIDGDELFFPGEEMDLTTFFEVAKNYDIIQLRTLEVINRRLNYNNVFAEETFFKTQKNFASKLDQIYFKLKNPYDKKMITTSYWLGQTMGKSIINVKSKVIPHNVHRFKKLEGNTKTLAKGFVLHYHMFDLEDFKKKFTNFKHRPRVFLSGNTIGQLKLFFIQLVNDTNFDEDFLKNYYVKNLLFDAKKMKRLEKTRLFNIIKRKEKAYIKIELPKKLLS